MSSSLIARQAPDDNMTKPCIGCRALGQNMSLNYNQLVDKHRVLLSTIFERATRCRTCAILRSVVEEAVDVSVMSVPVWIEIMFKQTHPLYGPLRIDIVERVIKRLQLYVPTGSIPSPWSQIGFADHIQTFGLSEESVALALRWVQSCTNAKEEHVRCLRPVIPPLPTRVIYVGKSDDDIRLHISAAGEKSYYTSLSHCWGGLAPVRTTLDLLKEYTVHIPTPLPQTFADAISVTRVLGIPFIWIDSLCIVQDSKVDWIHEAGEMATIYTNSFLTISADAATDSSTGFLSAPARTVSSAKSMTYSYADSAGTETEGDLCIRVKGARSQELPFHTHDPDVRSKLSTRGWAFQERLLSSRTIHFSKYEMAWECRYVSTCECSANSVRSKENASTLKGLLAKPRDGDSLNLRRNASSIWRENIVPTYTSLDLTFKSDRLLAITGLATAVGRFRQETYAAGIWKGSEQDLLWYINSAEAGTKTNAENVPTWSWSAVDGEVAFITMDRQVQYVRWKKHVSLQLRNVVENPSQYGTPAYRPSLLVTGRMVPVRVLQSAPVETQTMESHINHIVVISSLRRGHQISAIYDSVYPSNTQGPFYFLLMTTARVGPVGLLLAKSKGDRDCFERVGLVCDPANFHLRVWRGDGSNWSATSQLNKLDATIREKAWKKWKRVSQEQTFKIV